MNYLGHSMLNPESANEKLVFGNVCGDFFKGKLDSLSAHEDVLVGIKQHRLIDSLTDSSTYFLDSKKMLKKYRLYSGVIVDMFNDHFLAKNFKNYSTTPLKKHSSEIYEIIDNNEIYLGERGKRALHYMKRGDWLGNYGSIDFLEEVLYGISTRFKRENTLYESINELKINYKQFEDNFYELWSEINIKLNLD